MFRFFTIISFLAISTITTNAATLKMKFDFSSYSGSNVTDDVSGINATMQGSASIYNMGTINALSLGASSGYLDMKSSAGTLLKASDNYSVSVFYRVNSDASLSGNGFFLWAFSTAEACGSTSGAYTAYRLNAQRIATSTGGYSNETGYEVGSASQKGKWIHVAYTQSESTGTLYINGVLIATIDNMPVNSTNFSTAPAYCWIGRAPFSGDNYLANTLVYDFELYDGALSASEVADKASALSNIEYAYKFGVPGSTTALSSAISAAQTALSSSSAYLPGAVEEVRNLVAIAQVMVEKATYSQPYIDDMTAELNSAVSAMRTTSAAAFDISDAISSAYDYSNRGFKHPGGMHTQADFDRVKQQIANGNEKVTAAYNILKNAEYSQATVATYPVETIVRGGGSGENYINAARGATMAYQNALRWKIEGTTDNANAAVRILMAWANVTKVVTGDSNYALAAGLYGYQFAQAAELMRDYEGWSTDDFQKFKNWMLKVWYTPAIQFLRGRNGTWENAGKNWQAPGHYWSNWGLCNALCVASIGILCDDVFIYNQGMSFFKYDQVGTYVNPRSTTSIVNDGLTEFLGNLVVNDIGSSLETGAYGKLGQMNESGRDTGHAAMAAGLMVDIAKVGYNQGDDLFAYMDHRLASGIEYLAAQTESVEELPWTEYVYQTNALAWWSGRCWTMTGPALGAQTRPYWGTVIGIYEGVKGVRMPFSEVAYTTMGIDGGGLGGTSGGYDHLGYSVLMNTYDTQLAPAATVPTELSPQITTSTTIADDIIPSLSMEQTIGNVSGTTIKHSELGGLVNHFTTNLNTTLQPGTTVTLQPQLPTGETDTGQWIWDTGQTTRDITVTINQSKIYRVTYTNANGVKSEQMFAFAVKGDCNFTPDVLPYINYDGVNYQTNEMNVPFGEEITLWIDGMAGWGAAMWDNGSTDYARTITVGCDRTVQFYYVNQGGRKQLVTFNIHAISEEQEFGKDKAVSDGWEKITSISTEDCEDYVYLIFDKDNDYMIGLDKGIKNGSEYMSLFYQQPEEPTQDLSKVWSFEVNGSGFAMRNLEYAVYQLQTENNKSYFFRTHDQVASCTWTGVALSYDSTNDYWNIQATRYGGYLGPWGNIASDNLPAADGGYEIAGNRTLTDNGLGKYLIYRMERDDFFAMYFRDGGKGDISFMMTNPQCNGTTGWNDAGTYSTNQSWRNNIQNAYIERNSNGTMYQTLENMPAGYYKVVAALRTDTGCKITVALNSDNGTVFTGTGNSNTAVSQISMNGVQRPYTPQTGYQDNASSRGWQWGTAQTHLTATSNLQVKFITEGSSWMSVDDVYLYYSPDGTDYVAVEEGNYLNNRGKTVTADIILASPNSIVESEEKIVTANNVDLINNLVDGNVENLVLFDKYDYNVSCDFIAENATMYRSFNKDAFYTVVIPFNANIDGTFYSPLMHRTSYIVFEEVDDYQPGVPYLFKAKDDIVSFNATNTEVKAEAEDNENGYNIYMNGSFKSYLLDYNSYVLSGGKLYIVNSDVYIPAFRACFCMDNDGVKQMGIRFSDDDATDITDINDESQTIKQEIFTIDGRKINELQKGINIIKTIHQDGTITSEKIIGRVAL